MPVYFVPLCICDVEACKKYMYVFVAVRKNETKRNKKCVMGMRKGRQKSL